MLVKCEATRTLILWKAVCHFLIKLNIQLSYDSEISLLGYSIEMKIYVHTKICMKILQQLYS